MARKATKKIVKKKPKKIAVKRKVRRYKEPEVVFEPGTWLSADLFVPNNVPVLNAFAMRCHVANHKWWHDPKTGKRLDRNPAELIALLHSEASEMLEGVRKDKMDDHLPHRKAEEVEAADLLIRLLDYAAGRGLDIHGAFMEKSAYNAVRADHKHKNRVKRGGKKF